MHKIETMEDFDQKVLFFHVCTDGTNNGIVHFCEEDYEQANKIAAVAAYKHGVKIISHCHMTTHSHFVVWGGDEQAARDFGESFKHDYSIYMYRAHGASGVYQRVPVTVRRIVDIRDLKNCIAYTLLNPVVARMVLRPENWKWSSFAVYFNSVQQPSIPVSSLSVRKTRKLFKTYADLSRSGFEVDAEGNLLLRSFVDYKFVERLFGGPTDFFKCLALTDSASEELKYTCIADQVRYTDDDIRSEASMLALKKYSIRGIDQLTLSQKTGLLLPLRRKTGASPSRLARVLRLSRDYVSRILR